VADNAYNPLRALDRRVGKSASRAASRLGRVVADLRAAGLVVHQRFGVARSTLAPTTVFDLDAPVAGAAALQRVTPLMAGPRRAMTAGLAHLVGRGIGGPAAPGWMVLAGVGPAPNDPLRITGRIASLDSDESKMILGEPPEIFEKRYSDLAAADASAMALNTLHEHAPGLAPTPLGRSHPMRVRTAWISGRPLSPHGLNAAEIETWVEKAAEALRRMQDHTRRPDGSVLVHGDYWLGNLVVDDDRILAVIDWAGAHWGDPSEDREHLVASFLELGVTGEATADSLRLIVDGVFATQL
ncbi:MAG: phosphotransferase, partial [Acidimicrobiales bacterium]